LLSTCFSSFLLMVTLNHWHLGFHRTRMKLNKILICVSPHVYLIEE
jgi:hypothetical protein